MSTWYRTRWHDSASRIGGPEITTTEIIKSTSSCVYIGQRRSLKRSEFENFFETEAEAIAFIIESQKQKIAFHESQLAIHQETLARFEQVMPAPQEGES